jgi:hypothetical protein
MPTRLLVKVQAQDDDAEFLDAEVRGLRAEILECGVQDAVFPVAAPPPGTRVVDVATIGEIVVTVASSGQALVALARALADWLARGRGRRVVLELGGDRLELDSASAQQQERLVEAFLARRRSPVPDASADADPPTD